MAGKNPTLTITCCTCGTRQPLTAGLLEDEGKRFGVAMGELPPAVARAAIAYLRLFKPPKTELRTSRATTVVSELAALVAPGTVCKDERGGIRRPASPSVWVTAIEQMLATPPSDLPLANHNYLRRVAYGIADTADAGAERAREAEARQPVPRAGVSPATGPEDALTTALRWLKTQLDYGAITPEKYEAEIEAAKQRHQEGGS